MMHTTLYSHSGQGIRAGLSRWGTVPSRVPVSINEFPQKIRFEHRCEYLEICTLKLHPARQKTKRPPPDLKTASFRLMKKTVATCVNLNVRLPDTLPTRVTPRRTHSLPYQSTITRQKGVVAI
eukprot:1425252-Prymnesium_polylepis.1